MAAVGAATFTSRGIPCPPAQRYAWERAVQILVAAAQRLEPDQEELALWTVLEQPQAQEAIA